ncbi:MAG: hypothetical protein KAI64_01950, partial [Thermoplasmata archaeon]|nr:hypothetical protein [Thermoplasmata archaeon]
MDTFSKLADKVIKHHKKIIVTWIIILILSVPLLMRVGDVMVYEETALAPENIESGNAQEIIDEQFPMTLANSTAMVVIQSPDVRTEEVRNFTLALEEEIAESPDIKYLQDVATVYSVYEGIVESAISGISIGIYEIEAQANMTAFMFYGIPATFLNVWSTMFGADPSNNSIAKTTTWNMISPGLNATLEAMVLPYYDAFYMAWNLSFLDPLMSGFTPEQRTEYAIGNASVPYIDGMPISEEEKLFMYSILGAFNLSTWSNSVVVHSFSINMVSLTSGIDDIGFLEGVHALGPSPSMAEISLFSRSIVENGTLQSYPLPIPNELYSGFISQRNNTMLVI